jgi:hypothetical protein
MKKTSSTYYSILVAVLAMLFLSPSAAKAQKLNYEIVSMYVYNFTKYIEWPKDKNNSDFVVGVYGESGITTMLNKYISSKHVGERPIVVKVISTPEEAAQCSIIFIPADQNTKLKQLSEQLKSKPILIICEKLGMSKKGASISIYLDEDDDDKTKFEISRTAISASGLIISANLIRLAVQVY